MKVYSLESKNCKDCINKQGNGECSAFVEGIKSIINTSFLKNEICTARRIKYASKTTTRPISIK